jgi:cyclase
MEKKMFLKASNLIFDNAKRQRYNPTHSEMLLWEYLRNRPFNYKFRRQHPIAQFIADFYCHELKLIIEVDGSIHDEEKIILNDIERQNYLEEKGMNFLRFTNFQVEKQTTEVIATIENYIFNRPDLKGIK